MTDTITLDIPHWKSVIAGWVHEKLIEQFPAIGGIYYENEKFDPPQKTTNRETSSWFFVEMHAVDSKQIELGETGEWRVVGNVFVSCRTPRDIGTNQADQMASAVEKIFRGTTAGHSGLTFDAPWSRPLRTEDAYFQVVVTCPFQVRASK